MTTFLVVAQIDNWHEEKIAFTAASDQEAIAAGRAYRVVLADAFNRGFTASVRVRVYSLELGGFDGATFATTTDRELLDTWEDDIQARKAAQQAAQQAAPRPLTDEDPARGFPLSQQPPARFLRMSGD